MTFLLLECGFRVLGYFYKIRFESNQISLNKDNQYIVLCLGNSYTAGVGAPKGGSYPDHLQNMFDSRIIEKNIEVINGGAINQNTAELLNGLKSIIDNTNPSLIIIQTGEPNLWNHYGYDIFLERTGYNTSLKTKNFNLNDFLYNFRVYRMMLILYYNLKDKNNSQLITIHKNFVSNQHLDDYTKAIKKWIERAKFNQTLFFEEQKVEGVIKWFKKEIEMEPNNSENYEYLGDIYFFRGNYSEAAKWYMEGIKANPNLRNKQQNPNYFSLSKVRDSIHNETLNKLIDEFVHENSENQLFLTDDDITRWIESDIKEIIKIIQGKKIKIILQDYPPYIAKNKANINNILRKIANDSNVSFVDNERIFQEMWDEGEKKEDYHWQIGGVLDDHLNSNGYRVVAENIFDVIIKENLLNLTKIN